jgi:hypothetical protein
MLKHCAPLMLEEQEKLLLEKLLLEKLLLEKLLLEKLLRAVKEQEKDVSLIYSKRQLSNREIEITLSSKQNLQSLHASW